MRAGSLETGEAISALGDVLEAFAARPRSRTDLRAQLRVRNEDLGSVLGRLRHAGRIRRHAGVWIRGPVPAS